MTSTGLQPLAWDSEFFGLRIARAPARSFTPESATELRAEAERDAVDCVYALIEGSDATSAHALESQGARFVDLRVTLRCDLGTRLGAEARRVSGGEVRAAVPGDRAVLASIARGAHRDTRFYFDGQFPETRCDDLYQSWLENSFADFADAILVATVDGAPAGYITASLPKAPPTGAGGTADLAGTIGLIAVSDAHRGAGLGADLVEAALGLFLERGVTRARVVTQGRNAAAQRLYQRAGFVTAQAEAWYHLWPRRR